jgi:hypothetical protein
LQRAALQGKNYVRISGSASQQDTKRKRGKKKSSFKEPVSRGEWIEVKTKIGTDTEGVTVFV